MNGPTLLDIVLGLLPMLLLIGAWYVFMKMVTRPGSTHFRAVEVMERQAIALERIASALEKKG